MGIEPTVTSRLAALPSWLNAAAHHSKHFEESQPPRGSPYRLLGCMPLSETHQSILHRPRKSPIRQQANACDAGNEMIHTTKSFITNARYLMGLYVVCSLHWFVNTSVPPKRRGAHLCDSPKVFREENQTVLHLLFMLKSFLNVT